jgi:hypothetical protein
MKHRFAIINDYNREALYANGKLVKVAHDIKPNDILDFLDIHVKFSRSNSKDGVFPEYLKDVILEEDDE